MGLYQHPDFNKLHTPENRVRIRTDDPERIKQLKEAGYTQIPDDGITLGPVANLSEEQIKGLNSMGIATPADVAAASDDDLKAVDGIGDATLKALRKQVGG